MKINILRKNLQKIKELKKALLKKILVFREKIRLLKV